MRELRVGRAEIRNVGERKREVNRLEPLMYILSTEVSFSSVSTSLGPVLILPDFDSFVIWTYGSVRKLDRERANQRERPIRY